jgi:hypothetical protein
MSRQPAAVKPAQAQKRRVAPPPKPPDEPEYNPGDLVCTNCGAGNDPARRFCRRCGQTLVDAVVAQRPPWWRRIFRRRDRALKAGERPRDMGDRERRGGMSWLTGLFKLRRIVLTVAMLAAAAGISAYAFLPDFRGEVDKVVAEVKRIVMPTAGEVFARSFEASSWETDHEPKLVGDPYSNTYWAVRTDGDSPTLTVIFDEAIDFTAVIFTATPVTTPPTPHTSFDRPRTIEVSFPDSEAEGFQINLDDSEKPVIEQGFDARGITKIEFRFTEFWPVEEGGEPIMAISDMQFRKRN